MIVAANDVVVVVADAASAGSMAKWGPTVESVGATL